MAITTAELLLAGEHGNGPGRLAGGHRVVSRSHWRKTKYNNKKTIVDGIKFDSAREAKRWGELKILLKAERIRDLKRQITFNIRADGQHICRYRADFVYSEYAAGKWTEVVEDSKGCRTDVYKLKRKLLRVLHGIDIRET